MLVPDAPALRKALIENGFYMPAASCQLSRNTKFLMGILYGTYWVPKYSEVRQEPLPRPPMKKLLLEAIHEEIKVSAQFKDANFAITDANQVDGKWLIDVLATVNNQHKYFARGYAPEPKEKKEKPTEEITIDDPMGFFVGLHVPKRGFKKKGRNLFVTK